METQRKITSARSSPLAKALQWNLSKFYRHFGWDSLNVEPSSCLDVVGHVSNNVFLRHILLEIEFKMRVTRAERESNASGITHER